MNTETNQPKPPGVYYTVMVCNIIVTFLVVTLFILSNFDAKRYSVLPELVIKMIEDQASMQVRFDVLEDKIDELKRELEAMKRKQ